MHVCRIKLFRGGGKCCFWSAAAEVWYFQAPLTYNNEPIVTYTQAQVEGLEKEHKGRTE
jgi:hypothetical protein